MVRGLLRSVYRIRDILYMYMYIDYHMYGKRLLRSVYRIRDILYMYMYIDYHMYGKRLLRSVYRIRDIHVHVHRLSYVW